MCVVSCGYMTTDHVTGHVTGFPGASMQSKYISKLKKVADRRKLEQDIIYERKVQREMEREGLEHEDKDTFLTSAYRRKLEERRQLEAELKMAAMKEGG